MKAMKVGVIGLGMSGRYIHCDFFASAPEMYTIAAIADPSEERRKSAVSQYGCAAYESYDKMIENHALDIVVNASPNQLHFSINLDLLEKGCNVICEKPVAANEKELDTLIEAAKKAGRIFTVFQDLRYTPHFQQVKKVVDSGVLGRLLQISIYSNTYRRKWDWRTLRENNGGNLMNIGPHLIDQALQFLGADVMPRVVCRLDPANTFGDADNYLKLLLETPGKPLIDIEISSSCAYPPFQYNIQGICGGLSGWSGRMSWKYFKPEEAPNHTLIRTPLSDGRGNPVYCTEELKWYEETWEDDRNEYEIAPREYYQAFYKALSAGTPFEVTTEQVKRQMAIIEECLRQNPANPINPAQD